MLTIYLTQNALTGSEDFVFECETSAWYFPCFPLGTCNEACVGKLLHAVNEYLLTSFDGLCDNNVTVVQCEKVNERTTAPQCRHTPVRR